MSMYSQLVASALELDESTDDESTASAVLIELLHSRNQLRKNQSQARIDGTSDVLFEQLAYDVALIKMARLSGVECDADEFDRPERGRSRLEAILSSRGVSLDEIEAQAPDGRNDG